MLAREHRLTSSQEFRSTVRTGRRSGSRTLVLHLAPSEEGTRVGFVVSKAVGIAVVRNRVKRRLRQVTRERLETLPGSSLLVVRALPAAAGATQAQLAADFERCLERVQS